jgi:hypothetical protein
MPRWTPLAILLLTLGCQTPALASRDVPPEPTEDPGLVTAGFLTHHPDMKYRVLGMQALREKRYDDALRFFRRASFYADKPSQGMVAEMYWNGQGVPVDRALAYAWMDLAAERGYRGFLGLRERYWAALTPEERERAVREGEAVYARFGDDAAKPRYEFQLRVGRREMTGSRTGFNRGLKIEVPGPGGGSQWIDSSKYFDDRYWDARKYWAWQDKVWKNARIGRGTAGDLEDVRRIPASAPSRVPAVAPDADADAPDVPDEAPERSR